LANSFRFRKDATFKISLVDNSNVLAMG